METLYAYAAAIGAALLIGQLLLSLLGFGEHGGLDGGLDGGHDVDFHGDLDGSHADAHGDRGGNRFVGFLSVRAIVAALAVFGLVGLGLTRQFSPPRPGATLVIALAAGGGVMYAVAWLLRALYSLRSDGTVRIERTVGLPGSTYLTIPAKKSGVGKVTLKVQDRFMEYTAMTSGDEIPTGTAVVVLGVLTPQIVEVARAAAPSELPLAGHTHV
ncbi:MAG TPA: hypothetical protein VMR25_19065 [Planctomycetaceae bacterium]|jgi:hypothetical protein|nr:hypothetical protein [Planctomycetaceae bacterium]